MVMKATLIEHMGDDLTDYAWAAGIIEGEGTLSLNKIKARKNSWRVAVTVTMSDFDVIERLHKIFGVGTVRDKAPQQVGYKPLKEWAVQNQAGCLEVLLRIMPYLGQRRLAKAKEMLEYLEEKVIERD
jgi:hypothetical protein